ncbi:nitroreductase family protein [Pseudonocardia sp.]|uniref:nitroreductase family protein n=1 Tax=Pseudonocardia sp. TaxID=60912 RepID=UPI0039C9DC01
MISADIDQANAHFAEQPPLGRRGERYVWLAAGHVSQNLYLAATERGLGASLVAGFDDTRPRALTHKLGTATAAEHPWPSSRSVSGVSSEHRMRSATLCRCARTSGARSRSHGTPVEALPGWVPSRSSSPPACTARPTVARVRSSGGGRRAV